MEYAISCVLLQLFAYESIMLSLLFMCSLSTVLIFFAVSCMDETQHSFQIYIASLTNTKEALETSLASYKKGGK